MKVLSVNKYYWRKGGSEAVFFNEMELLKQHSHEVVPFSMKSNHNYDSEYSQYFVNEVDYENTSLFKKLSNASKVIYSFDARNKISRLLKKHAFDVAHFHIFQHQISPSIFGPLKKQGIPLVLTLHDLKPICPNYKMYNKSEICELCKGGRFYNATKYRCNKGSLTNSFVNTVEMYLHYALGYYQSVDRYIAVSRFYQEKMIEHGFPPEKVTYIPNMLDLKNYDLSEDNENYALYFGRLSEEKDVLTLLKAAREIPHFQLVIAGTGPDSLSLQEFVENENIDNVKFVGYQSGDSLKQLIMKSSFTILPSRWYENCPMSVLESFAYGKPVIGARIGGIPELIIDGVDGLLFNSGDSQDLIDKVNIMSSLNTKRVYEMGVAGREKVRKCYSPERHYEELMTVYKSVGGR